jgi:hypothetical protein
MMNEGLVGKSCNLAGIMAYHCTKYEVILVRIVFPTYILSISVKMFEYRDFHTHWRADDPELTTG